MALVVKNRVKDTTSTTGTGTYTLANSPPTGFQGFSAIGSGNETYYVVEDGTSWEAGKGTVTFTGAVWQLSRGTIYGSSNAGAAVNWGAGTRNVFVAFPAEDFMLGSRNLSELANVATARTNLGLGSIATVNSPVPVANGGTGSTTAAGARTALDVVQNGTLPAPAGTKTVFYQAAAPTGWVQDTSVNDRVMRVVSAAGGGTGGSWTITGVTAAGTALTAAQLPNSGNIGIVYTTSALAEGGMPVNPITVITSVDSTFAGGDTAVNVLAGGSASTHTHTISADGSWRPAYLNLIVATKS